MGTLPVKDELSKGRSRHRCGLFREAVSEPPRSGSNVSLAPHMSCNGHAGLLWECNTRQQHFSETGRTPKKAADD
jgi:hypothetical protein